MKLTDEIGEQVWAPKCPLLALSILAAFAIFFPMNALASGAYLKENAPKFIDKTVAAYGAMVDSAALLHDADPKLILAVIVVESEGNARVVSHRGAQGLMQLMPKTAKAMGAKNPKEPQQNILAGTRYLKELENDGNFKSPQEVLVAYNMGPNAAKRWLAKHEPEEYRYVKDVTYVYHVLEKKELEEGRIAKAFEEKLALEDIQSRLKSLVERPTAFSVETFPMTIPSGRRDEIETAG